MKMISFRNPTPNVIINRPGGPNVYDGVPIDYSGEVRVDHELIIC